MAHEFTMSSLRIIEQTAAGWGVPVHVPDLLRPPGLERPSRKGLGWSTAGGYRSFQGRTWPGRDLGVRAPDDGETPLSRGEIEFILDYMPPMDVLQLFPGSAIARSLVMQAAVEQLDLQGRPWYVK